MSNDSANAPTGREPAQFVADQTIRFLKARLEYIPLYTLLYALTSFGLCYLYYLVFNVEIHRYMSYGEMLLEPLTLLFNVFILVTLYMGAAWTLLTLSADPEKVRVRRNLVMIGFITLYPMILSAGIVFSNPTIIKVLGWLAGSLAGYGIVTKGEQLWGDVKIFIVIACVLISFKTRDAIDIANGQSSKKVSFKYDGQVYATCDSIAYIGACEKYLFLYNTTLRQTQVFKTEELDSLVIKQPVSDNMLNK